MDPFTFLIGLAITGYVVGGVATDAVAVAKRQTPPSIQKARERHERKMARGEQAEPSPSYLGRVVGNATERWATRSDQRHRDRMQWLDEQAGTRSAKWLTRKRRNAQRYERAAQGVADKSGVLWGKTRDAADKMREQHKERQAWRRNATEPDVPDDDDPVRVATENGWHLPIEYDDEGNAWARHPDGTYSRYEEPTLEQQDYVDEQVPDAQVLEFARPDRAPEPTERDSDSEQSDTEQGETVSSNNNQSSNAATDARNAADPSFETAGLTATLSRTQASADNCTALVAEWDQRHATLLAESTALETQIAGIETQIASLQQAEISGDEIEQLRAAQEQYTAVRSLIDQQAENASTVLEAYQAAAAAFGQAHSGFEQQIAGQDFYSAHQGAGNKEFMTQG